ncbi:MAG: hypothetical protein RPU39_00225 [Candidatus Sedimenticola sp. (ex Thyasira tokunagai)]
MPGNENIKRRHFQILQLISAIRNSFDGSVAVYTQGGCFQFYLILRAAWSDAQPWYDGVEGHVLTKLGKRFYDITGEIRQPNVYPLAREPRIARSAHRWSYPL